MSDTGGRAGLAEPGNVRRRIAGKSSKPLCAFPLYIVHCLLYIVRALCEPLSLFPLRANFHNSQQAHVLLIPRLRFAGIQMMWMLHVPRTGSGNLLWISSAFVSWKVKRGEKKQMLMWFLAKLRPFLNAPQEIEADRQWVSGFFPALSLKKKPSNLRKPGKTTVFDHYGGLSPPTPTLADILLTKNPADLGSTP